MTRRPALTHCQSTRRSLTRPAATRTAAAALALLALTACSGPSDGAEHPSGVRIAGQEVGTYLGTNLDHPYVKPAVVLTDNTGAPFDFAADTKAPVTLVFFGYTNCPDVCFTELSDLALALRKVPVEVRDESEVVFITTDPARDTPEVMTTYLERFGFPSYVGLTGSTDQIAETGLALGIAVADGKKLPSGGYEVAHGTQVIGFGPDGTAPVFWNDVPHDDMARDIAVLASAT